MVTIFIVYTSALQGEFEVLLNELVDDALSRRPLIISTRIKEWISRVIDSKNQILLNISASLEINLLNSGTTPTFARNGINPIIDATFASENIVLRVLLLQVSNHYIR